MKKSDETGFIHLTAIIVTALVIAVGGLAYWRVSNSNNKVLNNASEIEQVDQIQTLPTNLDSLKTIDQIGVVAGVSDTASIISFKLESENGSYIYRVVLSDGRKLVINAASGEIISEETTDISEDDKIPSNITITMSPSQAFQLATTKSSSPIKTIEMEVEDKKVVYKIEYKDGSKIEIDASSGAIVKSEIKNEAEDTEDKSDEDQEDKSDEDQEDTEDKSDEDQEDEEDR